MRLHAHHCAPIPDVFESMKNGHKVHGPLLHWFLCSIQLMWIHVNRYGLFLIIHVQRRLCLMCIMIHNSSARSWSEKLVWDPHHTSRSQASMVILAQHLTSTWWQQSIGLLSFTFSSEPAMLDTWRVEKEHNRICSAWRHAVPQQFNSVTRGQGCMREPTGKFPCWKSSWEK